ncbi:MAG TPA: polysaccharide biosynthesis protein [Anaerolineales bacterium]|nr:polysaccharide biosynthesis protein [Anaerolineales bacterium]
MKVLVTGGAGFLGRGILRQVQRGQLSWEVTVYSRDETKQDECRRRYPFARYVLGDVRDTERLTAALAAQEAVVHAAAMKYIPEAELNAEECVRVNIGGAESVIRAVRSNGWYAKVVGISTDKAVQPVNVYGATKMVMERLFADTAQLGDIRFCCVRYGNVVGSTGSVIPLFQRQYAEEGRVKITNPNMTRFWMSVDEAVGLVATALEQGSPGGVLVPFARAMKIEDVAKAATEDGVEVEIIGERPGEKLHEMLLHYEESVRVRAVEKDRYFELLPPGSAFGESPFTLASHTPHHWMSVAEMRELIRDAREI